MVGQEQIVTTASGEELHRLLLLTLVRFEAEGKFAVTFINPGTCCFIHLARPRRFGSRSRRKRKTREGYRGESERHRFRYRFHMAYFLLLNMCGDPGI